jgi:hypothetical protein
MKYTEFQPDESLNIGFWVHTGERQLTSHSVVGVAGNHEAGTWCVGLEGAVKDDA